MNNMLSITESREKFDYISVNFVDMSMHNGPAVNEIEFNRWLLSSFSKSLLLSPVAVSELHGLKQVALGRCTLRRPIRFILTQIEVAKAIARLARRDGAIYYRHSRLSVLPILLKWLRPDLRLLATRLNGTRSADAAIEKGIKARLSGLVELADWALRKHIARTAEWVDTTTPQMAANLASVAGRKVEYVPNGVNCAQFKPIPAKLRSEFRAEHGIPQDAIIVGYAGGFPTQRGALQALEIVQHREDAYAIVIGKLTTDEELRLKHPRVLCFGKVPYNHVSQLIGQFDVGLSFDVPERVALIGNSQQKLRQYLACGVVTITASTDLPLREDPILGCDLFVGELSIIEAYDRVVRLLEPRHRRHRYEFARSNLSPSRIFGRRHEKIESREATDR
ncbi:glycosyltransferase family 4 protein [Sphingomonas xanthus]|uniref:Glycosyltransferase family 4 protein n=1 Tax=Sphingomonas xanthus TaxID=2594473 RepID=A0A516IUA4_9SPHN|nr:glycosyltransferase family 4 protein [Sphingomonas xanthus]QDP20439.1 glycosyltransferase family 4 protein [Sphingomonas xanthus]